MSNGPTIERLQKLLAHYDAAAGSLRTVIAMLRAQNGGGENGNGHGKLPPTLRAAVSLDATRRGPGPGEGKPRAAYGSGKSKEKIQAQRRLTAARLAKFHPTEPRGATDVLGKKAIVVGALVARGYLKRKDDGYVRTAKEFRP